MAGVGDSFAPLHPGPRMSHAAKTSVRRADGLLFPLIALAIVFFVFAGFSRTYYLHSLFHQPAPSRFLQFHAILMSGWILLLLVQSGLIWMRKVRLHRRLGIAGVCYAALIPIVGTIATFQAAAREVRAHSAFAASQLDVLSLELTQVMLFSVFVGLAIWLRKWPGIHKRLMLVATLCILPNVIVRISLVLPFEFLGTNQAIVLIWSVLVLGVVAVDWVRGGRLHPALGYGASIAIALLGLAELMGRSAAWQAFATGLVT